MSVFHPLPPLVESVPSPKNFTYPFCYQPHPLCQAASIQVRTYLRSQPQWQSELELGKMMGVLVVQRNGERGFLAAFSGTLAGIAQHPYFVPPVFDATFPGHYFAQEQARISAINHQIDALQSQYHNLEMLRSKADEAVREAKSRMKRAKAHRDYLRATMDEAALQVCGDQLIRESQFLKAELRRIRQHWQQVLGEAEAPNRLLDVQIAQLEAERKKRSNALQDWLFRQYVFSNAAHEQKDLLQIFGPVHPPSGAGDCCAPKLLQACYRMGYKPVCMAEFWVGRPPRGEVRVDGHFYPACHSKCRPILQFMLQGLNVDPNPLQTAHPALQYQLRELFRTDDFLVVSKPSGLLSVPGKDGLPSVYDIVRSQYPQAEGPMMVHRLDMDTSGIMVVAFNVAAYRHLQELFSTRQVTKIYLALLEYPMRVGQQGNVSLPLALDFDNRPCRMVDETCGKPAFTHYRVLDNIGGHALVELVPHTGRTHQLRVHCAHCQGLNNPIIGDRLYGTPATRLMLHAARLAFESYEFEDDLQDFPIKSSTKNALLQ